MFRKLLRSALQHQLIRPANAPDCSCLRTRSRRVVYTLGDYHIYQNHLEQVQELLRRQPFALPPLEITDGATPLRGLQGLLDICYENVKLVGYQSHGKIAAAVAV
jgi:thymidylate synthase